MSDDKMPGEDEQENKTPENASGSSPDDSADISADVSPDVSPDVSNVAMLYPDAAQHRRMLEALLFAAAEPLDEASLAARLPAGVDVPALLEELVESYALRGVNLIRIAGGWAFRTASDLAFLLREEVTRERKLSAAAVETLAIIAYHQPVTRGEIEEIRGVSVSRGTLDVLLETEWIRPRGRRKTPGRPLTFGTTKQFEDHFGLESVKDLPGLDELKAAGLLNAQLPPDFRLELPDPDSPRDDEEPLAPDDEALTGLSGNVVAGPGMAPAAGDMADPPDRTEN